MLRFAIACAAGLSITFPSFAQDGQTGETEETVVEQTPADFINLALREMASGDWTTARTVASGAGPEGATFVTWRLLRDGGGRFQDYASFIRANPGWPQMDRIRAEGEKKMPRSIAAQDVLDFIGETEPQTGIGVLRLADAYRATDRPSEAEALLIKAWQTMPLTDAVYDRMLRENGAILAPHHETRVDNMLWRGRITDAQRLISRLDEDWQALAKARIALRRNSGNLDALIEDVPEELADHPGLAYERFRWRMAKGLTDDAIELLAAHSTSAEKLGQPQAWSNQRRQIARAAMRSGEDDLAYILASNHFTESGIAFTDLEWLSGYLALRKMDDPITAYRHFSNLDRTARTPISIGRAGYWQGRALDEIGAVNAAQIAYRRAGQYQTAFYGLLAAQRANLPADQALAGTERFGDWRAADWAQTDVAKVAMWLEEAGRRSMAEVFFLRLSDDLDRTGLGQLGHLLTERGASHIAVRVGKRAAERGIVLPEIYFPLHPLAEEDMNVPQSLALAIARRESEFDPVVSSPVGAQGLMQLMPATAREVSGWLGEPYLKAKLTTDPPYNARLGIAYLEWLKGRMGNTPAMIAAGYNAGPGRPLRWTDTFGDPRLDDVDAVDWIEHIPFRETRNYVMRVTESMPVYEARLTGRVNPVDFEQLIKGIKPITRPTARPSARDVDVLVAEQDRGLETFRPQARPTVQGSVSTQGPTPAFEIRPNSPEDAPATE
ncbi:transglycosylase SLT domain-containing protein [Aestuariibius insulae]|uniref:lytic transglycosylase domain-containing protein n=1 Tax=Aestuariibius insulae TaxID=2058287 RepID=UPI00345EC7E2